MDITLNLTTVEIKEAIIDYVSKRGFIVSTTNDISFVVEKGLYDYYDNPTSSQLTKAKVTAKQVENEEK